MEILKNMDATAIAVCFFAAAYVIYFIADQIINPPGKNPFFGFNDQQLLTALRDYVYRAWGDCQPEMKDFVDFVFAFEAYSFEVKKEIIVSGIVSQMMNSPESADYLYELYKYEFRTLEREFYLEGSAKSPA